ncbi:hypothetical protein IMSAG049_00795 [Clostridiales bacterium]|nr:hypothetical protein IMSAG049_00795 [Clostridiales bacterium]
MYSFGRDFDEGLEIENIFREYIEKNGGVFMDRAESAQPEFGLDVQRRVFNSISEKLIPFVHAAVNGIEAAGFLDMENVLNDKLVRAAAQDAFEAAIGFYGQFEEYYDLMREFWARRFLMEKICAEMITVEFLNRINCI